MDEDCPESYVEVAWDDLSVRVGFAGQPSPDQLDDMRGHAVKAFVEAATHTVALGELTARRAAESGQ